MLLQPGERRSLGEIAGADRRRRLRSRAIFAATWAVIVGGLVAVLALGGAIDLDFLNEGPPWWRFILGEISISCCEPTSSAHRRISIRPFASVSILSTASRAFWKFLSAPASTPTEALTTTRAQSAAAMTLGVSAFGT